MNQVVHSLSEGVMHVAINRPERKNALTNEMYSALGECIERAGRDAQTKVVLFSGAGGCFTAGNDLDDFLARPPRDAGAPVFRFLRRLALLEKPVVAAVEGMAIGVGTTLLLHCDLVYAAEDARFALPFANLGLVPEAASSLLLPRLAGHQRAAEKLLLGDPFPASEALAMGFVNRLLPAQEVLGHATAQARRLASLPPGSVCGTKILMKGLGGDVPASEVLAQMDQEIGLFAQRVAMPAAKEAFAAFKAKRKPDFAGLE